MIIFIMPTAGGYASMGIAPCCFFSPSRPMFYRENTIFIFLLIPFEINQNWLKMEFELLNLGFIAILLFFFFVYISKKSFLCKSYLVNVEIWPNMTTGADN